MRDENEARLNKSLSLAKPALEFAKVHSWSWHTHKIRRISAEYVVYIVVVVGQMFENSYWCLYYANMNMQLHCACKLKIH